MLGLESKIIRLFCSSDSERPHVLPKKTWGSQRLGGLGFSLVAPVSPGLLSRVVGMSQTERPKGLMFYNLLCGPRPPCQPPKNMLASGDFVGNGLEKYYTTSYDFHGMKKIDKNGENQQHVVQYLYKKKITCG